MNDLVIHRGPNHGSTITIDNVSLGHRRLSIIDLSEKGNQPMKYLHYYITYNGEIYNHNELKEQLKSIGYTFTSNTDTEVILAAYDNWKEKCLDKFRGMFAFIIYDTRENNIFVARDRFGIKPLYYWNPNENTIYFASEIKQFTAIPGWDPHLNKKMAKDFLIHGLIDHTNETMFKDIFQIRGGYYLKINTEKPISISSSIVKWYTIKKTYLRYERERTISKLQDTFISSLSEHLISDVPVGSCLSGGLDSSSIVCGISTIKSKNNTMKTFTSCSTIPRYDEKKYVDTIVRDKKIENYCVYPDYQGLISDIKNLIWQQDEPPQSSSIYAQMKVFQLAKQNNIKVMLDGQGADEIFAGYIPYFFVYLNELFINHRYIESIIQLKNSYSNHKFPLQVILQNLFNTVFIKTYFSKYIVKIDNWLDISKLDTTDYNPSINIIYNDLNRKTHEHITETSLPALLHWEDRNSMSFSIEARVPFLDHRIVEIGYNTPPEDKLNNGVTKFILRESVKNIIPTEIYNRKDKMGFVTPEEIWMKENSSQIIELLDQSIKNSKGIIKPGIIDKFTKMTNDKEPFTFLFFRVISFGIWLEIFNVKID